MHPYLLLVDLTPEKIVLLEQNLKSFQPYQKLGEKCFFLFGDLQPADALKRLMPNLKGETKLFLIPLPTPVLPGDL